MENLFELLKNNDYPGRGIVTGKTTDGKFARVLYFIMGRSVNSRNRVFTYTGDGIQTQAFDPSQMKDPSLIIYHPVRFLNGECIVTNGDQTDTIRNGILAGGNFRSALMTRTFEPDCPNWTPRISAIVRKNGDFEMSILKSGGGDPRCTSRFFFSYESPIPGFGHFFSTYKCDGNPLPSFVGEPPAVSMEGEFNAYAEAAWEALNPENKVSLYACDIELATGDKKQRIINKNI